LAPTTLVGFAAMIAFTAAANLMLKLGAGVPEAPGFLRASRLEVGGRARAVRLRRHRLRLLAAPSAA
jgi:hypothetical protein